MSAQVGGIVGIRVMLAILLVFSALLFFNLALKLGVDKYKALLASVAVFAGIPVVSQITFLTGSYPLYGTCFSFCAIFFSLKYHQEVSNYYWRYPIAIGVLYVLASVSASSFVLMSAVSLAFVFFDFLSKNITKKTFHFLLTGIVPSLQLFPFSFRAFFRITMVQ